MPRWSQRPANRAMVAELKKPVDLRTILEWCRQEGVSLRLVEGQMRQSGAGPELLAELKAHREELRGVLGSRAWPWLGFVGFELEKAVCACGNPPWVFTEAGEGRCKLHIGRTTG